MTYLIKIKGIKNEIQLKINKILSIALNAFKSY